MQKHTYIAILAIVIVLMFSSLGLPEGLKQLIIVLSALGIIILSLFAYREHKALLLRLGKETKTAVPSFVDNATQVREN
jgi:hypothetical protein